MRVLPVAVQLNRINGRVLERHATVPGGLWWLGWIPHEAGSDRGGEQRCGI